MHSGSKGPGAWIAKHVNSMALNCWIRIQKCFDKAFVPNIQPGIQSSTVSGGRVMGFDRVCQTSFVPLWPVSDTRGEQETSKVYGS
jgi:hypothetical protein